MIAPGQLVGSPTLDPQMPLEQVLDLCAAAGFDKFEAMTSWAASALDIDGDPDRYRQLAGAKGIRFASIHLPAVSDDLDATLPRAIKGAQFARELGADVVIFKANSRETYGRAATPFLDATASLSLTTVITNHVSSPIATLADYEATLDAISDTRMKGLLEVGHFHAAGVRWPDAYRLLQGRIGLVHIKDMHGAQPVPYGEGEVDFEGLFNQLETAGYGGYYVFELEKVPRDQVSQQLTDGLAYLDQIFEKVSQRHV